MSHQKTDVLGWLDEQPLRGRYWLVIGLTGLISAFDFFDFFVVAYLVAYLAPGWNLTYGQSGIILLSAGVGAIIGAIPFGMIADRVGRVFCMAFGGALCGLCSLGIALMPDGEWELFAVLRFGVGLGLSATMAGVIALSVEHTPTRLRTLIGSVLVVFSSGGPLIASLTMSSLIGSLGWRGVAALGAMPLLLVIIAVPLVPESTRWLVSRGRKAAARRSAAVMTMQPLARVPDIMGDVAQPPSAGVSELFRYPRQLALMILIWLGASTANNGVYLWGPTIIALKEGLSVKDAASMFVYVALAGLAGKLLFSFLANRFGRVAAGLIGGYGIAIALFAVAIGHDLALAGVPLLLLMLIVGALFYDGLFANLSPYSAEVFPVSLAARGVGVAQTANGIGKIIGPLALALVAGTDNLVTPTATAAAITPGFLVMTGAGLFVVLGFQFLGIETHGKALTTNARAAPTEGDADTVGAAPSRRRPA